MDEIRIPAKFLSTLAGSVDVVPKIKFAPVPISSVNLPTPFIFPDIKFKTLSVQDKKVSCSCIYNEFNTIRSNYSNIFFSTMTLIARKGLPFLLMNGSIMFATRQIVHCF